MGSHYHRKNNLDKRFLACFKRYAGKEGAFLLFQRPVFAIFLRHGTLEHNVADKIFLANCAQKLDFS